VRPVDGITVPLRVGGMFVIQVVVWYSIFAFARRLRRGRLELSEEAG